MYIDTHAHYDSEKFDSDRHELLASMPGSGVDIIIDPGCDEASSRAALALAERYDFVYAAVGWQPEEWESWDMYSPGIVRELARHPRCVAIGEIGLDYYWDKEHKEIMYEMFVTQLEIALELNLPVIIHDREAHADCLEIVGAIPASEACSTATRAPPRWRRSCLSSAGTSASTGRLRIRTRGKWLTYLT